LLVVEAAVVVFGRYDVVVVVVGIHVVVARTLVVVEKVML